MRNKKAVYVLLPLVLGLWCYIGWQIWSAVSDDPEVEFRQPDKLISVTPTSVRDTFTLHNNYPDPFLGSAPKTTAVTTPKVTTPIKQPKPNPGTAATWPQIFYGGMIKSEKGKTLAVVGINGISHMLQAGEVKDGIMVRKILKDSVLLKFGKEERYFRK